MWSQKRVYSHVRSSSTVHKQENIVWIQVEKDINTGVFIVRTVDLTVWLDNKWKGVCLEFNINVFLPRLLI